MNLKQFVIRLYLRTTGIVRSPHDEWIRIKNADYTIWHMILFYILPLSFITILLSCTGSYLHPHEHFDLPRFLLISALRPMLVIGTTLVVAFKIMGYIFLAFKNSPKSKTIATLLFFAFTPVYAAMALITLLPSYLLAVLPLLYTFFIMRKGVDVLTNIPVDRKTEFSNLCSLVVLTIFLALNLILSSFFGAIHE
jgi:hypothetical protein